CQRPLETWLCMLAPTCAAARPRIGACRWDRPRSTPRQSRSARKTRTSLVASRSNDADSSAVRPAHQSSGSRMRRAIKRALRAFARPFNSRYAPHSAIEDTSRSLADMSGYIEALAGRHHETRTLVDSLNTHLPGMMAVITNQNAALRSARRNELRLEEIEQ